MQGQKKEKVMDRDIFDEWFSENIDEWIEEAVSTSDNIVLDDEGYSDIGTFFRDIASAADLIENFAIEHDYNFTLSSCYSLLGTLIDYAVAGDWLDDSEEWGKISELFFTRANEFVGDEQTVRLGNSDISGVRAIKIAEFIVYNFDLKSTSYSSDDFLIHEKLSTIREIILGLRTNRFLESTPLLSRFLSTLYTDWRVLGGGFGSNMGSGTNPWSSG